jgi:type VI secretion system protein ImpA
VTEVHQGDFLMPSSAVLDLEALLAPIPGNNPAGESVRYAGVYDAIQEARRADDDLNKGEWQTEAKVADWRGVINLATEALGTKCKDLQIGVWLVEALSKRHGFAGLREGLNLLRELHEQFWDGLYPQIEEGDLEFRAGPLNWLNEKLPASIRAIALTAGNPPYALNDWDESRKIDNLGRQNPEAMQAAIAEGKITGEQFDKSVEATDRAFFEGLFEDLAQSKEQLSRLEKTVDEKFGPDAPSLIKIRNGIDDCHQVVGGILKKKREEDPAYKPDSVSTMLKEPISPIPESTAMNTGNTHDNGSPMAVSGNTSWAGDPRNREEAFQRLAVLAVYLKRVEPQHPVTYLLERAVRWTKMPLDQWLGEVVSNQDVLNQLRETLGIKDRDNT